MTDLSPRQQEVLTYIIDCWYDGWIPTHKEISRHLGMNTSQQVTAIVVMLRAKGILRPDSSRIALASEVAANPNRFA